MQYEGLAPYYDLLINDVDGQLRYLEFVKRHVDRGQVLELACGSGILARLLAQAGYQVKATDLSSDMIGIAKNQEEMLEEYAALGLNRDFSNLQFEVMDMRHVSLPQAYDAILCFCDSLNYILEIEEIQGMFASVYQTLKPGGLFLFDCHSMDRLTEFAEPYEESHFLGDLEYEWIIQSQQDRIKQLLKVWDDSYVPVRYVEEEHHQRVYDPRKLEELLKNAGFTDIHIWTDFDYEGIINGEKQFFAGRKQK